MLDVLIDADLIDKEFIAPHTERFSDLQKTVKKYPPRVAEKICAVAECLIVEAGLIFGIAQTALSLWSRASIKAPWACKRTTDQQSSPCHGKIGRLGCGPFSLAGQPNAMGGREVGRSIASTAWLSQRGQSRGPRGSRAIWRVPHGRIAPEPGLTALEQFEALNRGKVKQSGFSARTQRSPHRISI